MSADYLILITDADLQVIGRPLTNWTSIDVTLRLNEPSSGLVTVPAYGWVREQLQTGARVVIIRNDKYLIAGPAEKYLFERGDDGDNAGDGVATINFADDLAKVAARVIYPNPALAPNLQTLDAWTYTGNAEAALYDLVERSAGTLALAGRQIPHLTSAPATGVGSSITLVGQQQEWVGDVLRRGAAAGGDLAFGTRQAVTDRIIQFHVFDPPDVSGVVRFGFPHGNMRYQAVEVVAPTANAALVGGQGTGADRFMTERVDTASVATWGRYEVAVLRAGTSTLAELNEAGDQALAEGAETVRVASSISDLAGVTEFGVHYDLGYRVAQETWEGEQVVDVVRTVHLQAWSQSGEYVSASVGSQAAISDPAWVKTMRALDKRLGYIERNTTPV